MERMTCIYEEKVGLGAAITRILLDNMTGVQYLVVRGYGSDAGVAVTPMLDGNGKILAAPMGQE